MQLVIAEKPSVARDLARVLGARGRGGNVIEGPGRTITWCVGHLVELEEPAAYDPRWKAWSLATLPMIPPVFKLRAVAGTRDQLRVVSGLLRDRRFSEVVNACDAGREGELIFRYVYDLAGSRLPVRRLWISSLTDEAIQKGFADLRPGAATDALGDAARCRSEADWLVGMNATRAVTLRFRAQSGRSATVAAPVVAPPRNPRAGAVNRRKGPGTWSGRGQTGRSALPPVYSIGRVQTPTLAILVRRELEIRAFVPRDYWEVRGTFTTDAAALTGGDRRGDEHDPDAPRSFNALWTVQKGADGSPITRLDGRALADELVARTTDRSAAADPHGPRVERLTQKRTREPPPQLFDLTSLQRTANRRYGMSASSTLDAAQALYERHKILTYPRTDSRHLPPDLMAELPRLFRGLAKIPDYAPFAAPLLEDSFAVAPAARSRRVFDATKVHDHHAIIPTGKTVAAGTLGRDEQRVFDLVARRFLGVFHPDAEFALTEIAVRVGTAPNGAGPEQAPAPTLAPPPTPAGAGPTRRSTADMLLTELPPPPDLFVARGRVRLAAGWQAVAGFDEAASQPAPPSGTGNGADVAESMLPPLVPGQKLTGRFEALTRQTRPPPRHSEATLLGAMESAGRDIDDESLRAAMRDTGLGTPATRAATIETLIKRGFVTRDGKQMLVTSTGISLIEGLPVPTLASPELTGSWEARLARIARGQETRGAFMTDIVRYVREITDAIRADRHVAPGPSESRPPSRVGPSNESGLPCPRCRQGGLIAGNRGWGCSRWRAGCPFVVWFDNGGKRITDTQLRDLIIRGKTRKAKWPGPGKIPKTGRLVLNLTATAEQGAAIFLPD